VSKIGIKCDIYNGAIQLRSPKRKYWESAFSAAIAFERLELLYDLTINEFSVTPFCR
jgi:hypothetical protein